jgi:hypothetical protein
MRALSCLAAVCVFSVGLVAADNPFVGTWKLNTAKSKGTPGMLSKEATVVFEAVGDQMKRTVTGVDPDGEPVNSSSTIPWDGKEHKVEGPKGRPPVMVTVKPVNDRRVNVTVKSADGKVVSSGHAEVSKDGKTMTATFKGEDPKGRKFDNVEVFDKQ